MTQKQMTPEKEHRMIAKFMGLIHLKKDEWINSKFEGRYNNGWYGQKTNSGIRWTHIDCLDYSNNWNLLMQVVEKIEEGNYGFKMCRKVVEIYLDNTKEVILKVKNSSRRESLFEAIVKFIKILNK